MNDEELEVAFQEARAEENSPETDIEQDVADDGDVEQDLDDDSDDIDEDDTAELDDEELADDSEHPEEDSDHDTDGETDDDVESDENTEETDEANPDGDAEEDEAESTEEDTKTEDESQQVQSIKFKANGQDYEFSDKEIKDQFPRIFGQAMDYTKKMQSIKPWRKTIDAMEQAKLNHEDVNLMIDVLGGNKEAVSEVLKRTGVDALDLDSEDSKYVAKDYGRDENALNLQDVLDGISKDEAYTTTQSILGSQWDEKSWNEMSGNPELIKLLHVDVQNGMYDKVSPIMDKLKVFDGGKKSDLEYYKEAAKSYFGEKESQEAKQRATQVASDEAKVKDEEKSRLDKVRRQEATRAATKKASGKRKAAAPATTKAAPSKVTDYLDDDDESFDEWYEELQKKM